MYTYLNINIPLLSIDYIGRHPLTELDHILALKDPFSALPLPHLPIMMMMMFR
jgi:hypothetical protein